MIYWELFWGFLKVGCFSFGGAYAAIPLIREVVLQYGWITEEQLTYMIAVSESTPGPIMVNLATYVGSSRAGMLGAVLATFATVLPAFFIILLITGVMKKAIEHEVVKSIMQGIAPCVIGIILATGLYMTVQNCVLQEKRAVIETRAVVCMFILAVCMKVYKCVRKKKMSPIVLILMGAMFGVLIF